MRARAWRIGSIRGIDVRVHASWIVIALLIGWSFFAQYAPGDRFGAVLAVVMAIVAAGLFFGSVLAHELAHSLEARHRGVHVGGITLFLFGGVTETRFDVRRPRDEFVLTAVGPATSVVLAAVFGVVATHARAVGLVPVATVSGSLAWINAALAAFNLLPGAPLDGGRILRAAVWGLTGDRTRAVTVAVRVGQALGLLLAGYGLVQLVTSPTGLVNGVWLAFIGWFLYEAAAQELAQHRAGVTTEDRSASEDVEAGSRPTGPTGDRAPAGRGVRTTRQLVAAAAVAIVVWAALVVPLPLLKLAPAPAQPVPAVIDVDSTSEELHGQLLYTAVTIAPVTTVGGVQAWLDPHTDVQLRRQVVPADVDPERFFEMQRRVFHESLSVAAAVGERLAGREVSVSGDGARVVSVLPGAPAEEELQPGDVIVAVEGERVELASELVSRMGRHEAGDEVTLAVQRGDRRIEVTVTLRLLSATDRAGFGVLVQTVDQQVDLAVPVQVAPRVTVGGPSAGLMMALTVYDVLDPTDLAAGRTIAGTGTVDLGGNVGPIGAISEKVRGAELAGADLFLAPESQVAQARAAAPAGMTVIGVRTAQDAVDALRGRRDS